MKRGIVHIRLAAFTAIFVVSIGSGPARAAGCPVAVGRQIVLASSQADPDVFVWDTKARMLAYAEHSWRTTRDVMDHTAIAEPGTRAVVVQCEADTVKSNLVPGAEDAVGVRLLTGNARGTYGWVTSEDVRPTAVRVGGPTASPVPRITRRPTAP